MARPITNGKYSVPKEIDALKPSDIDCFVKVIYSGSQNVGSSKHYYVYTAAYIPDPRYPGRGKHSSGTSIGKIEGGKFVPNKAYRELKANETKSLQGTDNVQDTESSNLDEAETARVTQASVNMKVKLRDIDLQIKNYGEYAMVLASTQSVLKKLEEHFNDSDARMIYALSVIYFIEQYTPASYIKDVYDQSILSNKWPTLPISEKSVNEFIHLLGSHPAVCEEYSQSVIDDSSGLTAIDGHVILCCSKQNDLADYGNKYQKIGNMQVNLLQAYDVEKACSLASKAYEGGLPDKSSVRDLLTTYDFPEKTCFLVDMGFYSEEDMELYRADGKHFVIPVPENAGISKAMLSNISFSDSFAYEKKDEDGLDHRDRILYRTSTVKELEDLYQKILDEDTERKNQAEEERCRSTREKPRKYYTRKIKRSDFPDDLVIMFRDSDMHDKMVAEFESQIGMDAEHTEERLAQLAPGFGIILLRCNFTKQTGVEKESYCRYKKRWSIETHYNFVENTIHFCGLHESDYIAMQGLSFLTTTFGQVKSAFIRQLRSASPYASRLSIKECMAKAGRTKLALHKDKKWHVSMTVKKNAEMLEDMGVKIAQDIEKLNNHTF